MHQHRTLGERHSSWLIASIHASDFDVRQHTLCPPMEQILQIVLTFNGFCEALSIVRIESVSEEKIPEQTSIFRRLE